MRRGWISLEVFHDLVIAHLAKRTLRQANCTAIELGEIVPAKIVVDALHAAVVSARHRFLEYGIHRATAHTLLAHRAKVADTKMFHS